jgi:hypothetical protein
LLSAFAHSRTIAVTSPRLTSILIPLLGTIPGLRLSTFRFALLSAVAGLHIIALANCRSAALLLRVVANATHFASPWRSFPHRVGNRTTSASSDRLFAVR